MIEDTRPLLRLGFHYHVPMYRNVDGRLITPGYLGRFLDELAAHCGMLICFAHSPRADEIPHMDYVLTSPRIEWVNIGPHTSVPRRVFRSGEFTQPLRQRLHDLDCLLIRGPSPLLPAMARAAGSVPVALLIVGDYTAGVSDLPQPRWRKEAIRAWSWWNRWQERLIARRTLTFVNSRMLYDQLRPTVPNLVETRTTTLSTGDFFEREDTCQSRPIRVLYTGRLDRAKGLLLIVEAVGKLVRQDEDITLDLVGWAESGDPIEREIRECAHELGILNRVTFHGFKAVGPELFAYYKSADIYVIASMSSFEGFPRTIWEAMAHSVPVVATRVGSIPLYLADGVSAVLVEPRRVDALVRAIHRLVTDSTLRRRLIAAGRELAGENTIDKRTTELYQRLEKWLR